MSTRTIIDEIERVPTHLTKCLDMLERWEGRLSCALDATKKGHEPSAAIAKQLGDITNRSTAMAKEMRAWVGKVTEVVQALSIEDKLRVSLALIQQLGTGDRLKFYNHLSEVEKSRQDGGIGLFVTNHGR